MAGHVTCWKTLNETLQSVPMYILLVKFHSGLRESKKEELRIKKGKRGEDGRERKAQDYRGPER